MRTTIALSLLLAAAALPASPALAAGRPIILDVHGLDFNKFSCSDFSSIRSMMGDAVAVAVMPACAASAGIGGAFSLLHHDWSSGYLAGDLRRLCGDCDFRDFTWSGAPRESREAVDQLSSSIRTLDAEAKESGRPFVIVSHSWGTVLTAETLWEMADNGEDVNVDQLVTMGSPLGGPFYGVMIDSVIPDSRFREKPQRARSIRKWYNYYSKRDPISHRLGLADADINIDDQVPDGYAKYIKFNPASVFDWHSAYFEPVTVPVPDGPVELDIGSQLIGDYLNPPVYTLQAAE